MKVTLQTIEGHRALTYTYTATPGVTCQFHLLCEVGEPWQAEAKRKMGAICRRLNMTVQATELSAYPWYVDALVAEPPPSPEQIEALEAFKQSHGRLWKEKLNHAWQCGSDANEKNGHLLRQIRNQYGPFWLINYRSKT